MRVSPTRRGYTSSVYQSPPQKYTAAYTDQERLIVLPPYNDWLVTHPDVHLNRATADRMIKLLTEKPRDRRRSFSASSAGYCMRRQELAYIGVPKIPAMDPRGVRIFNNGTFVHLRWQVGLLMSNVVHGIEVTVTTMSDKVRATLDGMGVAQRGHYKGAKHGWEHKGRMSYSWKSQRDKGTPDDKTRKQIAMQFWVTGYDVWSVTNENKDTQEATEFVIERDEKEIDEVRSETKQMLEAVRKKHLHPMLPECIRRNSTGEYYKCPFGTDMGSCVKSGNWPTSL